MNDTKFNVIEELAKSVVLLDDAKAVNLAKKVIADGIDIDMAITSGLVRGMAMAGEKYEKGEYFVPELLVASDVMNAGLNILRPGPKASNTAAGFANPKVVIGVIEGDVHEIGKNLVKLMLETAGFQIIDLGPDVPIRKFMETAVTEDAGLICLSGMMSTSLLGMKDVINMLNKEGLRKRFRVMVGGACVSAAYAHEIGADGYAGNAMAAVREAKSLMK